MIKNRFINYYKSNFIGDVFKKAIIARTRVCKYFRTSKRGIRKAQSEEWGKASQTRTFSRSKINPKNDVFNSTVKRSKANKKRSELNSKSNYKKSSLSCDSSC